tara:strand:+ start:261 stop:509 length:249 start_codon:yes stop_codon:yes gene_type:complete
MTSSKIKIYAITLYIFEKLNNKLVTETFGDYIKTQLPKKTVILIWIIAKALQKKNIYKNYNIYIALFKYIKNNTSKCFRSFL